MFRRLLPVSVVIPTRNRSTPLRRTLESLASQSVQPAELIIVDASEKVCAQGTQVIPGLRSFVSWLKADVQGAASQRNQGTRAGSLPVIGFMDDDILLESECIARLWDALNSDPL